MEPRSVVKGNFDRSFHLTRISTYADFRQNQKSRKSRATCTMNYGDSSVTFEVTGEAEHVTGDTEGLLGL